MDFNQAQAMTDCERMTDLLSSQKFLCGIYNTCCCEAATPAVRSTLCSLLQDTHRVQEDTFNEMNARGWYKTEAAELTKINEAKQKFGTAVKA